MIKRLWEKYREIIMYLIFGVLTTVVGLGTYFVTLTVAEHLLGITPEEPLYNGARVVAQILQWVLSVLFAYFTNKHLVFRAKGGNEGKQMAGFFAARLFSLGADSAVTFGTIFFLGLGGYRAFAWNFGFLPFSVSFTADLWAKLAASVVVVILNYVLSKFIVFKKQK